MITKRLSGLVALALMLLLASCGKKTPSYTKFIPKDASYVIGIDVRSILEKLNKDSLSVENMMTTFKDEGSTEKYTQAVEMYKQFKDAGIDWSSRVYVAVSMSGNIMNGGGSVSTEAVAGMKDVKKFEEFLKKQPQTNNITKGDGFSYTGNGENTIGWNDDAVIVLNAQTRHSYDDSMPDSMGNMTKPPTATGTAANVELLKKLFKQDKNTSIAEAEGFSDLQSKKADVVVYSANADISKSFPMLAGMDKLRTLLKGYSTSLLNFEDGKVVTESTLHLSKELADLLKKYAGPEVDLDLIENYPSSNVDGVVAFSFKPELIPGLLKELGYDALANQGLQQAGLTTDEVARVFKGDFAVVVSDFGVSREANGKDAMGSGSMTRPTAKAIFMAKLGDKAVVEKLLKLAQAQGLIVRNGNSIAPNPATGVGAFPFAVSIANDVLVFASDSATFNAYQSKSQKISWPSDAKGILKGKAISAYVDIEKIMAGISPTLFDSSDVAEKALFDKAKATFKNGWYTVDNLSGNTITGKAELNLVDTKKNSLAQIVRFGLFAYEQQKARSAAQMKEWESMPADSAVAVPDTAR